MHPRPATWLPISKLLFSGDAFHIGPSPLPARHAKGNINRKGERIYHVPSGQRYDRTGIDPAKGERWFCSEDEARPPERYVI